MKRIITYFILLGCTATSCKNWLDDVKLELQKPVLKSPKGDVVLGCCSAYFYWDVVQGATSYELQLTRSPNFQDSVKYRMDLDCMQPGNALPSTRNVNHIMVILPLGAFLTPYICIPMKDTSMNGKWYWRVKAKGNLQSPWSDPASFVYRQ